MNSFRFKDSKIQRFKNSKIQGFKDFWSLFTIWDLRFGIYDLGFTILDLRYTIGTSNLKPETWNRKPETWNPKLVTRNLKLIFFALCASVVNISHAQLLTPLSNEMNQRVETEMIRSGQTWFSVVKPFVENQELKAKSQEPKAKNQEPRKVSDSLAYFLRRERLRLSWQIGTLTNFTWFKRKLLYESFVQVDSGDFYIFADPLFDFCVGKDNTGRSTYTNTRGFRAGGRLGKNFAFGTEFYENQSIFPAFVDAKIRKTKIIPGQGRGRLTANVWDYSIASGYLSFNPAKKLNVQLGQGKHFIGDGYRSLLLSDYTYNYPYIKSTWVSDKFMYSWMVGLTQNLGIIVMKSDKEPFKRELISMHLLSLNATKWLQVSVMQFNIFNNPDTFGTFKPAIDVFNPLMIPTGGNKDKHSLWGINLRVNPMKGLYVYQQWVIDNFFTSYKKYVAVQAGFKYYDVAGLHGLYVQSEFNRIPIGMYTSAEKPVQWINYGEPLAHPLGNGFEEGLLNLNYTFKRLQIENMSCLTRSLANPGEGFKNIYNDSKINFYLNAKTLMHFSLGYIIQREDISGVSVSSNYVYFAFRTGLRNVY